MGCPSVSGDSSAITCFGVARSRCRIASERTDWIHRSLLSRLVPDGIGCSPRSATVISSSETKADSCTAEMQPYADACASNRQIWQNRLAQLVQQESTPLIQHDYPDAVRDPRLFTLFPLLLPPSLLVKSGDTPPTTPKKSVLVRDPDSPATKAMRAVYHSSLMDARHRLGSWSRGAVGGWEDGRRSSTPDGIMRGERMGVA